ncbi:aldo/keto reductase [Paenibacillus alvei]|uniref:aldo/keto reductase n=1 Tax=Paenibacillus alvei TaxID=44250 RepID=UPI0013DC8623|nr:aldo/keto reductase [Paenibacillus alvei]NEZ41286.1 oxidoreductase [Paenibacillus alvei]
MKFTTLKKTSIEVSEIGFGTNAVGGHNNFANVNELTGKQTVQEAIDQGITFLDTADAYGFGRSEQLIGEVIRDCRNNLVLATKGGIEKLDNGSIRFNNDPRYLRSAVEASMKRLQTDYIDLYYLHFIDGSIPLSESVGELTRLKSEGKIRAIGISNATIEQVKQANATNELNVLQSPYHMLDRSAEQELLPYCLEHDISFIPYGPLAFGILGGKYQSDMILDDGDWRKGLALFQPDMFTRHLTRVEKLKAIASEEQLTLPNLALAWLLHQPGVDAVIPGGKRVEQIRNNAEASGIPLSASTMNQIKLVLEE